MASIHVAYQIFRALINVYRGQTTETMVKYYVTTFNAVLCKLT